MDRAFKYYVVAGLGMIVLGAGGCPNASFERQFTEGQEEAFYLENEEKLQALSDDGVCQLSLCGDSFEGEYAFVAGYGAYLSFAERATDYEQIKIVVYDAINESVDPAESGESNNDNAIEDSFLALQALLPTTSTPDTGGPFYLEKITCELDASCALDIDRGILVANHQSILRKLYTLSSVNDHFFVLGAGQLEDSLASYSPYFSALFDAGFGENILFVDDSGANCLGQDFQGQCISAFGRFTKTSEQGSESFDSASSVVVASLALLSLYFPSEDVRLLSRVLTYCSRNTLYINMCQEVGVTPPPPPPPPPPPVPTLEDLYNNPALYKCFGRACVGAETPYYSAKIEGGGLTKTLIHVFGITGAIGNAFGQLLPSGNGYVCVLRSANSYCSDSEAPIAVNRLVANKNNDNLPSAYAEKVSMIFQQYRTASSVESGNLVLIPSSLNYRENSDNLLRVVTMRDDCVVDSDCVQIELSTFDDYGIEDNDIKVLLPIALVGLRGVQLFTLFPDALVVSVRNMLRDNVDCVVSLSCPAISNDFVGNAPFPALPTTLEDLYDNPALYKCFGRACVGAETPYYSAKIERGGLTKTLIHVFGNDGAIVNAFGQLLPSGNGYVCVLRSANSYCSDSEAPIAVNHLFANIGGNLPSAYAEKVSMIFQQYRTASSVESGNLVLIPSSLNYRENSDNLLRVVTMRDDCVVDSDCVQIELSTFDDYGIEDNDIKVLLPIALVGLRGVQLFTLFPDALVVSVRNMLRDNVDCVVSLSCPAISNDFVGNAPFPALPTTLEDLYDNPALHKCFGRACVGAETPYYSAKVERGGLTKTLIHVFGNDGAIGNAFGQLLPSGNGYVCVLRSANSYCSDSEAPIAVNRLVANKNNDNLPSAYAEKVSMIFQQYRTVSSVESGNLVLIPSSLNYRENPDNLLRVGTMRDDCVMGNCVQIELSTFDDYGIEDNDIKVLLPIALVGLRGVQLFTLFPDAPVIAVRNMLRDNVDCVVSLSCPAISNDFVGNAPFPALPTLEALYDNPALYECFGRACVGAETPYYSAKVERGGLTKTLLNAFGNDALNDAFEQLLPSGNGYICVVKISNNYCANSDAPIAVNPLFDNRYNNNLPGAYADKMTIHFKNYERLVSEVGSGRLVLMPSSLVGNQVARNVLHIGNTGNPDYECSGFYNCVRIDLSALGIENDDIEIPLALVGLRGAQLFTLFPGAPVVAVRNILRDNVDCVVRLSCFAINNHFLSNVYREPSSYECFGRACMGAETPYYSAKVEDEGSRLTKTLINVFGPDGAIVNAFGQLLPSGNGYICVLGSANSYCSDSGAPIAVNYSLANIAGNLPSAYTEKVFVTYNFKVFVTYNFGAGPSGVLHILNPSSKSLYTVLDNILRVEITGDLCDERSNCIKIESSVLADYGNQILLPLVLVGLRGAQLFTLFPGATTTSIRDILRDNPSCVADLECSLIEDNFLKPSNLKTSNEQESGGDASENPSSSDVSENPSSGDTAGASNSFISDVGSMDVSGKRQIFWSWKGVSVETRSSAIDGGNAHALALTYRSMMGNLDVATGWTTQSSALGLEEMLISNPSVGLFGAVNYDVGSFMGMRPYVGAVVSWHSMIDVPDGISSITANEFHGRVGVDTEINGMRFGIEGRCGRHDRLIGYGYASSTVSETSCGAHLKASVSF